MSWNVHSLRKRFIDILHYTRQEKPDIICLQEALHGHNKFFIRGYTKYEHNTSQGLVIYVCNNLPHEMIENSPTLNNNDGNTYMLLKVNIKDTPFYVCNTYVQTDFFDENKLPDPLIYENIIYAGDFNAKHPNFSPLTHKVTNTNGRRLHPFITQNGMNIIGENQPTHLKGGRLDYFIKGGLKEAESSFRRINLLISDHYAIECNISLNIESYPLFERLKINIPVEFVAAYRAFMSKIFRGKEIHKLSAQYIYDKIVSETHRFHETYIKKSRNIQKVNSDSDWTNDTRLKQYEQKVKKAIDTYHSNNNADTLFDLLSELREYSELKKNVNLEYFHHFLETINPHTSESKVWQKINAVFGKIKSTSQSKDAPTTALRLLEQYSLTSTYSNLPHDVRLRLEERKFDREMKIEIACAETHDANRFIDYITQMEIDLALSHGKSTAPGEDGITYQVIRHLNSNICDGINPIRLLFTAIYREGVLPWQWKHNLIIPVPKGETGKFRPISLTSCLCKVFERVILNRLQFSLHGKLSNNLYGFIRGRSTKNHVYRTHGMQPYQWDYSLP